MNFINTRSNISCSYIRLSSKTCKKMAPSYTCTVRARDGSGGAARRAVEDCADMPAAASERKRRAKCSLVHSFLHFLLKEASTTSTKFFRILRTRAAAFLHCRLWPRLVSHCVWMKAECWHLLVGSKFTGSNNTTGAENQVGHFEENVVYYNSFHGHQSWGQDPSSGNASVWFFPYWCASYPRAYFDDKTKHFNLDWCFAGTRSKWVKIAFRTENQAVVAEQKVSLQSTAFQKNRISV